LQPEALIALRGYYVLRRDKGCRPLIARIVNLERQCRASLTFRITVEADRQPICLEIAWPPDAKAVIADFFGS
jgi:hypothetical protein